MIFDQPQLAQGDVQAFLIGRVAVAAMHLHGHQRAGHVVAQMMRQPRH